MAFALKKMLVSFAAVAALSACQTSDVKDADEAGWVTIFDGKTLDGWTPKLSGEPLGEDKSSTFQVVDGAMRVSYENYDKFDERFGHIFYKEKLSHYRLKLEYRFFGAQLEGGSHWANVNSGVMLHSQDPKTIELDQPFPISVEGQFLGQLPDNSPRTTANICTPGTHIVVDGELEKTHCVKSKIPVLPLGEWVTYEVEVLGDGKVSQFVNGQPTYVFTGSQYDPKDKRTTDAIKAIIEKNGVSLSEGYIALQAESAPVEFRNIQLMKLDAK